MGGDGAGLVCGVWRVAVAAVETCGVRTWEGVDLLYILGVCVRADCFFFSLFCRLTHAAWYPTSAPPGPPGSLSGAAPAQCTWREVGCPQMVKQARGPVSAALPLSVPLSVRESPR